MGRFDNGSPVIPADALPIASLAIGLDGTVRWANGAAERLLAYPDGAVCGLPAAALIPGFDPRRAGCLRPQPYRAGELTAQRSDGVELPVEMTIHPSGEGLIWAFLLDASARRASEAQLHHMARHDALTGLENRATFTERARRVLAGRRRERGSCGVFLIDLDRFSLVNETLGPAAGDELLREAAWRLRACVRPTDTVARFGGDEFALLCEGLRTASQAAALVARIEEAFAAPFLSGERRHGVSVSIGGALARPDVTDAETLIRRAHTALVRAKGQGHSRLEMFDPAMQTRAVRAFSLHHRLRRMVDGGCGELAVAYQPIVALADDRLVGFEALMRWRSGGEQVVPAEFIPIAEATELIVPMGVWMLDRAIDQLARWRRHPGAEDLRMAVNLSPRQLSDARLLRRFRAALERSGVDPRALSFEITETVMMSDSEDALAVLADLRRRGAHVMLDDFGTGYSSLANVVRFPIDGLKIDRSFIEQIDADPGAHAVVDSVVGLARGLNVAVIAEGIETDAQRDRARAAGCQFGQGYRFGRPVAAEQATAWVHAGVA